jgi:hypothetical protein
MPSGCTEPWRPYPLLKSMGLIDLNYGLRSHISVLSFHTLVEIIQMTLSAVQQFEKNAVLYNLNLLPFFMDIA